MRRAVPAVAALVLCASCGRSPSYYLARGRELSANGKYVEAELNYRKSIQRDPKFGEGYYQLGLTELRLNKAREAYQDLSRAVALLPDRDDVRVTFADFAFYAYARDQTHPKILYEQATRISDELLAQNPKSYDGLRLKAYLAASDKKIKNAQDLFQQANAVNPMQPELILRWTDVLFQDNQDAAAETLARQLIEINKNYGPIYDELFAHYVFLKKSNEAEAILKVKVSNNPTDAGAVLQLASFYAGASRENEMKATLQGVLDNPAAFPQAHLQVGEFYQGLRRWDDAIHHYEEGARANPKEKVLCLKKIADVWLAQGKGERALAAVREIRKADPSDEGAQAVLASLQLASGKPEAIKDAVFQFQNLVKKNPENAVWHFNLGRALAAESDSPGARREFLEASRKKTDFLPPRLALTQQSRAEEDYQGVLRYTNEILAIDPNLPAIRMLRAVTLINTGNDEQARKELTSLESLFPDEVQVQLAVIDLKEKKYQEAEERLQKLLQKNPGNARLISGLVQAEAAQNQLQNVLKLLHEELDRSPTSEVIRSLLADIDVALRKFDPAIEQYQRLLVMKPHSAQYHLALGRAYQLKGDLTKAVTELREAGRLAPKDPLPPTLLAHAMVTLGKTPEAMNHLRHALELSPGNPALMNDLAYLMAERGSNLDEAAVLAQRAIQASPANPELEDTLAWIYFKKNMNDSALEILQKLVEKYPELPNFRYHFGMALLRGGDKVAARVAFKAVLDMNPSSEVRQNIETALAKVD